MQELITSYLIQKKECSLPGLGNFKIQTKPAELDVADKKIFPPTDEILFNELENKLSNGLITYVSYNKNLSNIDAEATINEWCIQAKEKLASGEKIIFDTIGSLQKNSVGNIFFQRVQPANFFEPVNAERVIHKEAEHAVLVGDTETTSGIMNEFYRAENNNVKKPLWKMWAIVMLAACLLFMIVYFLNNSFSESSIGNRSAVPVYEPPASYSVSQ